MSKLPKSDLDCYWSATGRAESTRVNPSARPLNCAPVHRSMRPEDGDSVQSYCHFSQSCEQPRCSVWVAIFWPHWSVYLLEDVCGQTSLPSTPRCSQVSTGFSAFCRFAERAFLPSFLPSFTLHFSHCPMNNALAFALPKKSAWKMSLVTWNFHFTVRLVHLIFPIVPFNASTYREAILLATATLSTVDFEGEQNPHL